MELRTWKYFQLLQYFLLSSYIVINNMTITQYFYEHFANQQAHLLLIIYIYIYIFKALVIIRIYP